MKWPYYKNIRKLYNYSQDGKYIKFTYYNHSYSRNTVQLILLLWEEIFNDFPYVSEYNIFISMALDFPNEVLLTFYVKTENVPQEKLLKFDLLSKNLKELQ